LHYCQECFGPLETALPRPAAPVDLASRPATLARYAEWLPLEASSTQTLCLTATPLHRAKQLGADWGLRSLWLKDETAQPSGSFKDRLVSVALLKAREFGLDTVVCASTGNLARSVALLAPRLGIRAHVLVPEHAALPGTIAVRGTYDEANRLAIQIAEERGWGVLNVTLHPFYADGGKTVGHEIAEQLGRMPSDVVCCMAGGSLLGKIHQGLQEMAEAGVISPGTPRMHGAQASGCAPIVQAFASGTEEVTPIRNPSTHVHSLAVGDPGDGFFALGLIRATRGQAVAIDDETAALAATECLQREGIPCELAGGVTLAAARQLAERGIFSPNDDVVLVLTGRAHTTTVTGSPLAVIDPTREAFDRLLG
jgi:threonine synthase